MELAYDIDVDPLTGTSCAINEIDPAPPGGPGGPGGPPPGRGGRGGGPGGRGGRGPGGRGRGGRGRSLETRQNEEICPDAETKNLVQQYADVSILLSKYCKTEYRRFVYDIS